MPRRAKLRHLHGWSDRLRMFRQVSRSTDQRCERLAEDSRLVCTISIKEAFDKAESKPRLINYPQQPVYSGQRRLTHLPFAVSV